MEWIGTIKSKVEGSLRKRNEVLMKAEITGMGWRDIMKEKHIDPVV